MALDSGQECSKPFSWDSRFDIETGRRVRTFEGQKGAITDLSFSSDGRWLLSSSKDGTLQVWDIPTARTLQVREIILEEEKFCKTNDNRPITLHMNQFANSHAFCLFSGPSAICKSRLCGYVYRQF